MARKLYKFADVQTYKCTGEIEPTGRRVHVYVSPSSATGAAAAAQPPGSSVATQPPPPCPSGSVSAEFSSPSESSTAVARRCPHANKANQVPPHLTKNERGRLRNLSERKGFTTFPDRELVSRAGERLVLLLERQVHDRARVAIARTSH